MNRISLVYGSSLPVPKYANKILRLIGKSAPQGFGSGNFS